MKLAVIPGDGIGPEVVAEGLKVLRERRSRRRDRPSTTSAPPAGTAPARCCPTRCSTSCASTTRSCSARSATRRVPPGVLERGLLLRLRFELDHHVNLRPARLYPGVHRPAGRRPGRSTWWCVREGTEGPYAGQRRAAAQGHPARDRHRGASTPRFGVERVVRDAFERAAGAGRAST